MGLVALLAAAFGVTNTMIMSVSERTREIGTLRAIGAQRRQVMKIFMSESFLIGAVGAVVGVFLGIVDRSFCRTSRVLLVRAASLGEF